MIKSILSEKQKNLLKFFSLDKNFRDRFYLSGGTALAEYYLHHRYSEDLDFFSEKEFDPIDIQIILKSISGKIGIQKTDFQLSFNRNLVYLHFSDEIIKTEFTYYPFTQLEKPLANDGLKIDSLLDIAVNKTFTIYQRPRSRDFIDLYLIIKKQKFDFNQLRKMARLKFDSYVDPLQMAQQLLDSQNLEDFPRMITPLEPKIWRKFWLDEAIKLKEEAIEK